ncbi:formate/nitrite transporter family protein [Halobaculum gomorrense]|uniref:Formate/nitrite transporter FocA, FNT family n=1 Tax=Halobaculum gomorrense TaxID=43928 RepID=A0A1M5Q4T5_9EURY|nr:formate/nitrite transporter family protein [Halobaculum gomorrense]SHH08860.1 Formate/nitrite transporter FocA, FNT family [Halobaculum gomorrense]
MSEETQVPDDEAGSTRGTRSEGDDQASNVTVIERLMQSATDEMERPAPALFLSAISAGLDIGFGPLLVAVVTTLTVAGGDPVVHRLYVGAAYSVGFVFVVLGGSELFTEHTSLAVVPVLDDRADLGDLGRLWSLVYAGNVVGGVAFAAFVVWFAPAYDLASTASFAELAEPFLDQPTAVLFAGAVLTGWLMGLLAWLVAAADSTIARVVFVVLVTGAIGFAHLPHSIAGNVEVLAATLVDPAIGVPEYLRFMALATLGNAVGGAVFVALLKYGFVLGTVEGEP